jgi:hypothetical protein
LHDHLRVSGSRSGRVQVILERVLWALSIYVVPIAVGLVTLSALFFWDDLYSSSPERSLELHVTVQSGDTLSPADAARQLALVPATTYFETKLAEVPVWFSFRTPVAPESGNIVELPSRHATSMACWDAASMGILGDSKKIHDSTVLTEVKTGYALRLDRPGVEVICRTTFVGAARLTAELWSSVQFDLSIHHFHRVSGLMDGGLIVLALFVLTTALINRQPLYLI